jgi:hypothetical protein
VHFIAATLDDDIDTIETTIARRERFSYRVRKEVAPQLAALHLF